MTTKPSSTSRACSIIGFVGLVLCVAATLGVWYTQVKLSGAVKDLFSAADSQLDSAMERVGKIIETVESSKVTVDDLRDRLKQQARENVSDRLLRSNQVGALSGALERADQLLELSGSAVESYLQTLELAEGVGLPIEADAVVQSLETLATEITDARETSEKISDRLYEADPNLSLIVRPRLVPRQNERDLTEEVELSAEDRGQMLQLLAQLIATFGKVDERLAECRTGLDGLQTKLVGWESGVRWRITVVAIIATLFFVWMGAGQYALWRRANS